MPDLPSPAAAEILAELRLSPRTQAELRNLHPGRSLSATRSLISALRTKHGYEILCHTRPDGDHLYELLGS